ncbi:MAG TPA: NYN domain-containing protein [Solirubrobacterales bacterium]|nr:NYN domain-containing protein [Solirubrobacterales bacterium]
MAFYIDGFNLFHGALKGKPYRWLDLEAFCQHFIRPRQELVAVKYFTALVRNRPDKPGQRERQKEYLRALATLPKVEIYYGHFLKRKAIRQLAQPPRSRTGRKKRPAFREVWIEEEKGSDVNLASQFLSDGFRARYDVAFVVSNDGDLKMPVEIGRNEFKASIIVINPHGERRSLALTPSGTDLGRYYRRVRASALRSSQLPLELEDEKGPIRCPRDWSPQK